MQTLTFVFSPGIALQTISLSVQLSPNTVKEYLRLLEVKGPVVSEELLAIDDELLEALLQDPESIDAARLQSLINYFPHFERNFTGSDTRTMSPYICL